MEEYAVDVLPGEVIAWLREDAGRTTPSLDVWVSKAWRSEADFDRRAYGIGDEDDLNLVFATGVLEVAPRRGGGAWRLILRVEDADGLLAEPGLEGYEDDEDLTLEAFQEQFLNPEKGEAEIILAAEDRDAWDRFQGWLAERRAAAGPS